MKYFYILIFLMLTPQSFAASIQDISEANVGKFPGQIVTTDSICALWIQKDAYGQPGYEVGIYRPTETGRIKYQSTYVDYDVTEPYWIVKESVATYEERASNPYDFELYIKFYFDPDSLVITSFEMPDENIKCVLK